ncbi:zinc knuckle domain [Trichoderma cornu-damae]|uniref:Zinc knuckle domain n=1 Tax=Trichoderma cornu-damae TaxID=654480 RepID=A0A9P8QNM0_9HYPO|nr:zinc knuckle domain [Trichoderma cornu-damae]
MATDQSNPGDFLSMQSSEDERPLPRKRRSPDDDDSASTGGRNASTERSKRARVSSASADSVTGAKVSEEGEIDDEEDSGGEIRTPDAGGEGQQPGDSATGGVFVPKDPPLYSDDAVSVKLPVFSQQREGSWHARFKEWVQLLCAANSLHAAELTPALIRAAYNQYIDIHSRLKPNKKRSARQAAERFEDASLAHMLKALQLAEEASAGRGSQTGASGQVQTPGGKKDQSTASSSQPDVLPAQAGGVYVIDVNPQPQALADTRSLQPEPQSSTKPAMHRREGVPSGADALEQQRRYFPSASDPYDMCLLCGREGHTADSCTSCSCRFCGKDDHWDYVCSSIKVRCRRCNQLGHSAAACVEKLALTKEEGLACSYCSSPDHLETECTQIWRSFHPETGTIQTVAALPVSCATCGSAQHYSGDCPQRQSYAANPTWSLANKSQYVDPACNSSAIEGGSGTAEPASSRLSELRIRGHASRANHVHYSEGEDSDDVEFLGRRAAPRPVRTGHIRVSTNLRAPGGGQQPPLPPDHRLLRGITAACRTLLPSLRQNRASRLEEEVGAVVEAAVEAAEEGGQGGAGAIGEESTEEANFEVMSNDVGSRNIQWKRGRNAGMEKPHGRGRRTNQARIKTF